MLFNRILFPELHEFLLEQTHTAKPIYMVGGCLRDALLGVESTDLDFVVGTDGAQLAKKTADFFQGAFYHLDAKRDIARTIIKHKNQLFTIDFARMRASTIQKDLADRDFTINAFAVELSNLLDIIDPLGGQQDLHKRILRPCSEYAFKNDPVRTIRAVRFIQWLNMKYDGKTAELIRQSTGKLVNCSAERVRDELFHVLEQDNIVAAMRLMVEFKIFSALFPELSGLADYHPGPPHHHKVLEHTIRVLEYIQLLCNGIFQFSNNEVENPYILVAQQEFSCISIPLKRDLFGWINQERRKHGLLNLAVLYHDAGKIRTQNGMLTGPTNTPAYHAEISAQLFMRKSKKFALSSAEVDFVQKIIKHHMREELKQTGQDEDYAPRVYTFFKPTGAAGLLIILMHLADLLATYEQDLRIERWELALRSAVRLLDGWFNNFHRWVSPPMLVNGNDLIHSFDLKPGKEIGYLLENIRQGQVRGEVTDTTSGLRLARKLLEGERNG